MTEARGQRGSSFSFPSTPSGSPSPPPPPYFQHGGFAINAPFQESGEEQRTRLSHPLALRHLLAFPWRDTHGSCVGRALTDPILQKLDREYARAVATQSQLASFAERSTLYVQLGRLSCGRKRRLAAHAKDSGDVHLELCKLELAQDMTRGRMP